MTTKTIQINLPSGLEARPVALLVQVASQFESTIMVRSDNKEINAKSIMGMMTLGLDSGGVVDISADGEDEAAAIEHIEKYLNPAN